jgi:hypothetical protein
MFCLVSSTNTKVLPKVHHLTDVAIRSEKAGDVTGKVICKDKWKHMKQTTLHVCMELC